MNKLKKVALPVTAIGTALPALPVLASDAGSANSAVVSAMTSVANDMTATATSIIPIALGVVGLGIVVVFGVRMFKKIANK